MTDEARSETAHTDGLLSAVSMALDAELFRQYEAAEHCDEAKELMEVIDFPALASVALRAAREWRDRQ